MLAMATHGGVWRAGIGLCAMVLAAAPAGGEENVGRPWMVSEAALPAGFPGPGPVGEVIVKTYPAHRLARADGKQGGNGAFMKLFRHIERNEIKMTAPVVIDWGDRPAGAEGGGQPAAMAFLYAQPTLGAVGQDPADPLVVVADAPETVVASIGLRGAYDEATMKRGLEQLRAWLAKHPEWAEAGPPRSLAYNSPFVPWFAKYSEVQMPVTRKAEGRPGAEPAAE
jgi:hypothetical protein